jgi:basic membrane protein A
MGGGTYDDAILKVVRDYPKMKFLIVSGNMTKLPNIISIVTGNPGVAYMAGSLMAMVSKTGKIGLIGGRATPPAVKDHVAVIAGAKYVQPNIRIFDVYTETYTEPAVGKQAGIAQIDAGVDIIFTNANNTAFGVFEACKERGILAVGAATDQNEVAPNTILTSTVYGTDNGVLWLMDLDLQGKIEDNKVYTMSLDLVGLAPFHSLDGRVPQTVKNRIAAVRQQLLNGKLRVPESYQDVGMPGPK